MSYSSELKKSEVAKWWADRSTFATSLLALLIDEYGTESFQWDPETVRLQIESDYGVKLSQVNMDKLMAMITALTTNLFYTSAEAFTQVSNALNDSEADFENWDPPTAAEAAWAITEITLNDPPKRREGFADQFSSDVRKYLGVILAQEGILHPPDVLQIAELDEQGNKNADETFADDPEMFAGFNKLSQTKSSEITGYVRSRVSQLLKQLDELPLQNRDHGQWSKYTKRQ